MPVQMNFHIGSSVHAFKMAGDTASPMQMAQAIKEDGAFSKVPTYKLASQLANQLQSEGLLKTNDVRQSFRPVDVVDVGFRSGDFMKLFGHLPTRTVVAIHRAPESKLESTVKSQSNKSVAMTMPKMSASVDLSALALAKEMSTKVASEKSVAHKSEVSVEAGTKELVDLGIEPQNILLASDLKQFGNGSSHKLAYHIAGNTDSCFVSIPIKERAGLERELKLYSMLASAGVRIPAISKERYGAVKDGVARYGVCMEELDGVEYKQRLSWAFVKNQVADFSRPQLENLKASIDQFVGCGALVTDLQVFILNTTGEMVVFDPSTVSLREKPKNVELRLISKQLARLLR
jgi:hypothetical protein